ncbi:MAG: riboflavin synthase [Leptospirales bacterium]
MFTGLVEETGRVRSIDTKEGGKTIVIEAKEVLADVKSGSSIAVNGVCLTVEAFDNETFQIFAVPETLGLTNIGLLEVGKLVNLERALKASDRLGGHIVQGHAEALADVVLLDKHEDYWDIGIGYDSPYLVPKGSIALDGISLTIHKRDGANVIFQIIPETLRKTNIPEWQIGTKVNIETDYLVKAIDNIARWEKEHNSPGVS